MFKQKTTLFSGKHQKLCLFLTFLTLLSFKDLQAQEPTITSFLPASGPIGTSVTITGSNFRATASQNIVFFGATRATVTAATTTSLTVTVPAGATYQPVTVLNTTTDLIGSSKVPFRVVKSFLSEYSC